MGKNYKINDDLTLEMDGKVYRLTKNNSENCSHCPLHNIEDCVELCGDTYFEAAERPAFEHRESIFVEVAENKETTMEEKEHKNEPDYKALYEEEHKKYEDAVERAKGITSNMTTLQSIREHIFPELVESEEEKLSKKLHECVCRAINNDKLPYEERKYISEQVIPYLEKLEKQKEQKATWSEEDEIRFTNTIVMLKEGASLHFNKENITNAVNWLKSLKDRVVPQNTWKPTEEQMKALKYLVDNTTDKDIESLYYDLKKL